jgi:hypothetical protein
MRTLCVDRLELRTTETSLFRFLFCSWGVFVSRGKKLMQLKFHLELQFVDFCTLYAGGVVHLFSLYIYISVLYIGGVIVFWKFFARGTNMGMIRPVFFLFLGRRFMGKYAFGFFFTFFSFDVNVSLPVL